MHKRFRHLCLALAALIAAGTLLAALIPAAEAATYKKGSSGAVVSQIQTKLKNWGYYAGDVDGIYGSATERAVRAFQRKNGLTSDGKAGAQTLEALGLLSDAFSLQGGLWDTVSNLSDHMGNVGFVIIGVFIGCWIISAVNYRWKKYDGLTFS